MKYNLERSHILLMLNPQKTQIFKILKIHIYTKFFWEWYTVKFNKIKIWKACCQAICQDKFTKNLSALYYIANNVILDNLKMLLRDFIESQFSYCPLIWYFIQNILTTKQNDYTKKHGVLCMGISSLLLTNFWKTMAPPV